MAGTEAITEIDQIDDLEFERRTLAAIRHELGLGGLARFLMTYRSGRGDYTADRHKWLDGITVEDYHPRPRRPNHSLVPSPKSCQLIPRSRRIRCSPPPTPLSSSAQRAAPLLLQSLNLYSKSPHHHSPGVILLACTAEQASTN